MGYARVKNKDSFQLHRWIMTGTIVLNLASMFLVMFPSLFAFYTTHGVNFSSGFSVLQIFHAIIGGPTTALTLLFIFNDLPQPTSKWIRVTAIIWVMSIVIGAAIYYSMPS